MKSLLDISHFSVLGNWKALWNLSFPNKVKVFFLWRLQSRGVPCPCSCCFCESNIENDWHCFIGCSHVIDCWRDTGLWHQIQGAMSRAEGFSYFLCLILVVFSDKWPCFCGLSGGGEMVRYGKMWTESLLLLSLPWVFVWQMILVLLFAPNMFLFLGLLIQQN